MKYLLIVAMVGLVGCNLTDDEPNNAVQNNVNNTADQPSENCTTYCNNALDRCVGDNELFAEESECLEACKDFPDDDSIMIEAATTGDTVQCRIYHLNSAELDPDTHCSHSSVASLPGKCVDEITACDRYCGIVVENCPALFGNLNLCLGACGTIPRDGEPNEEAGDTVQCRITHANFAISDAAQCTNASVDMSVACVD